jgi:DNA-binding HxlR family transcriptional regulator
VTNKKISTSQSNETADQLPSVSAMTEDIVGCKWSMTVLQLVRQGICRPGAMEHKIEGLTSKVLNERLKKLTNYRILHRHAYPEIPPRVEYQLTEFGEKFVGILDAIATLDKEIHSCATPE